MFHRYTICWVVDKAHPRMPFPSELLSTVLNLYSLCHSHGSLVSSPLTSTESQEPVSSHFETEPRDRPEKEMPLPAGKERIQGFTAARESGSVFLGPRDEHEASGLTHLSWCCCVPGVVLGPVAGPECLPQHLRHASLEMCRGARVSWIGRFTA